MREMYLPCLSSFRTFKLSRRKQKPSKMQLQRSLENAWRIIFKGSLKWLRINIFLKTLRYALVFYVYFEIKLFILENICVSRRIMKP